MWDLRIHPVTIKYCISESCKRYGYPEQDTKDLIQIVNQLSNQRNMLGGKKPSKSHRFLPPGTIWFAQETETGKSEPQSLSSEECNKMTQYLTGFMTITVTSLGAMKKKKYKWKDAWCILTSKEFWWSEANKDCLVGRMSLRETVGVKYYKSNGLIIIRSTHNTRQSLELMFSHASVKGKADKKTKMICMKEWAKWLKVIAMINKYPAEYPKRLKPHSNRRSKDLPLSMKETSASRK